MADNFKDFNLDFTPHPLTKDLTYLRGDNAIDQSIRNIVMTNYMEVPYSSNKSGRVLHSLFENFDPVILKSFEKNIQRSIENYEPRAEDVSVLISQFSEAVALKEKNERFTQPKQFANSMDRNRINIQIFYRPIDSVSRREVNIIINKVR